MVGAFHQATFRHRTVTEANPVPRAGSSKLYLYYWNWFCWCWLLTTADFVWVCHFRSTESIIHWSSNKKNYISNPLVGCPEGLFPTFLDPWSILRTRTFWYRERVRVLPDKWPPWTCSWRGGHPEWPPPSWPWCSGSPHAPWHPWCAGWPSVFSPAAGRR